MDISEYRNDDIRRAVSYVPQNIELFSKSIYDNIRVTRQSATLDEVREQQKRPMHMNLSRDFQCSITHISKKPEMD